MAYEPWDMSGTLFPTKEKKNEKSPDYYGDALIDGVLMRISGWKKVTAKGVFLSLQFEPKEEGKSKSNSSSSKSKPSAYGDDPF